MKKIVLLLIFILTVLSFSDISVISQESILKELKPKLEKAPTYEKYKIIYARKAIAGEEIKTYTSDGLETKNISSNGDFVVKNTTNAQEMYILTKEKFDKRYKFSKKLDNTWNIYKPIGIIKAVLVDDNLLKNLKIDENEFYIITSWNEKMIVKKDDYLVSPMEYNEVYRIANKEFFETYKLKK